MIISGNYIYAYKPEAEGLYPKADLLSPSLPPKTTTDCLSFYYYIHGNDVYIINLAIITSNKTETIWEKDYSAGDMWHEYKINIWSQTKNYQVSFPKPSNTFKLALSVCKHYFQFLN